MWRSDWLWLTVGGLAAVTSLAGRGWDPAALVPVPQQDEFRWTGRLADGKTLEVRGVNGDIRAVAASGREVEVIGAKRAGEHGDPDDVTFKVVEHGGGVTICAMYPDLAGHEPNECAPGGKGRMNTRDNDTQVSFTVKVPMGVNLAAHTVNGAIDAEVPGGNIVAATVNGDVDVSAGGYAAATTVNGTISAAMGRADWSGKLELTTVNGGIDLILPEGFSAQVSGSTVNGGFTTDFPLTVQGRFGPKQFTGTVGGGGRDLRLSTVNGGITLKRRG